MTKDFWIYNLTFDKESKRISEDISVKSTNSFTYVLPKKQHWKGVLLHLRRICNSDK